MTADIKYLLCFYPGQGLIILLSGPPGTGKTLTAEAGKSTFSVSNQMQKSSHNGYIQWQTSHEGPSNLHAEDLGTTAASTGKNLTKVFDLALEWNSIILLDGTYR